MGRNRKSKTDAQLLTIPQGAKVLRRPERGVRRDVETGLIPHVVIGGRVLISREFLDRLLRKAAGTEGTEVKARG
jgi:hypothetical protein